MIERDRRTRVCRPTVAVVSSWLVATSANAAESLDLVPDFGFTLPVLLAFFVVLIFPVNKLIFQPLLRILDEREERIAGARRRASDLQGAAQEVITSYQAAVREVREASERDRREHLDGARSEHASLTSKAREEAEREIETSQTELQASLDAARETLRSGTDTLAREMASRVLGRGLS